jgi:hypothetical protein
MVRVFEGFGKERQLRILTAGLIIESARDYTPLPGDHDYLPSNDVPWIKRFSRAGGKVIISGNTRMRSQPHERLALVEEGMTVFFFERQWSNWKFCRKCALLMHWWPKIAAKAKRAGPATFWAIPSSWDDKGALRKLSTEDTKLLKMERQIAAQPDKAAERKARRQRKPIPGQMPFDWGPSDGKR